jgi:hypothetical protein
MLTTGHLTRNLNIIDSVLEDETPEDAATTRPMLLQLRATTVRDIPAPSAALQLLLDIPEPPAHVARLGAYRTRRELQGHARYGARRRVAATSFAVIALLGAGTGVAAAMDGGIRRQIEESIARVGMVLGPANPAHIEYAPEPPIPVIAAKTETVATPVAPFAPTPEPVVTPPAQAVPPEPAPAAEAPALAKGSPVKPVKPVKPAKPADSTGSEKRQGTGTPERPAAKDANEDERSRGGWGGGDRASGSRKDGGRVPPGQAKKAEDTWKTMSAKGSSSLRKLKDR